MRYIEGGLGKERIDKAYNSQKHNSKGFFTLTHPDFTFPISYHIPAYYEDNRVDLKLLGAGIGAVMTDVISKRLKTVAFAPVGMSLNGTYEDKEKVIETIGRSISDALVDSAYGRMLEVYIAFTSFDLFSDFKRVLKSTTNYGMYMKAARNQLQEVQSNLISKAKSKDDIYVQLLNDISYVVNEKAPILLLGESGVGKSFLAETIHELGRRSDREFRSLNCASINPDDLYVQVFGYGKGAYTGVQGPRKSIFEEAEGGTVFLDEIGYANLYFQKSLLTFLDKGEFRKPGVETPVKVQDVRLIFGTNQDLQELVSKNLFQHDMYERIASSRVFELPPLRNRPDDVCSFAEWKLKELNDERRSGSSFLDEKDEDCDITFSPEALELLKEYKWPGNVRQLNFYVQNLFYDTVYSQKSSITCEAIRNNPPRDTFLRGDYASTVESVFIRLLEKWDPETHGKLKDDFLLPILAKVFLDDFGGRFTKQDAMRVLGMTANKKDSYLDQMYAKYEKARSMKL